MSVAWSWIDLLDWYVCWTAVIQHRAMHRLGNVEGVMLHAVSLSEGHTHTHIHIHIRIHIHIHTVSL